MSNMLLLVNHIQVYKSFKKRDTMIRTFHPLKSGVPN